MEEKNVSLDQKLLNKNVNINKAKNCIQNENKEAFNYHDENNNKDSEDDLNFYKFSNFKNNQMEKNQKEKKLVVFANDKIESTNDNSIPLYLEEEMRGKNHDSYEKFNNEDNFDPVNHNDDNNKNEINHDNPSIKNNYYINNNKKNEKTIKYNRNKVIPSSKNLHIKSTSKSNNINNNNTIRKQNYINFQNEDKENFEDNKSACGSASAALNQSMLKLSQKQNFYLKRLFEKTIVKKDQYSNYKRKKLMLSLMLFYIIIYFFCCLTLLIANCQPPEIIDSKYNVPFHMLDFWGSFGFALIEAAILVTADMVEIGSFRYFIVAINIGTTLIAAVLFSFNPEFWEIPCHWIEFSAQIFITLSDILFIFHQFKKAENNILYKFRFWELGLVLFFALGAVMKLLIFGEVIRMGIDAEQAAHFFEYSGEMVNTIFAFVFTLVMYKECKENLENIFDFGEAEQGLRRERHEELVYSDV